MQGTCEYNVIEKVSKSGNRYYSLELTFPSGYKMSRGDLNLLTDEQVYILSLENKINYEAN